MSAAENGCSSLKDDNGYPPPLSIKLMELSDLPKTSKPSSDVQLPVDILLLTVEDCEFLACHHYLQNTFRSYFHSFGYAYFGDMGEDEQKPLKVALVKCSKGSSDPGSSLIVAKNAVTQLRPKVTFSVGHCRGLNPEKAKLGDVVISSKLTTDAYKTPVSRDVGNLVRNAADGWKVPLENAEGKKIKVHCDGEILSCPDAVSAEQQTECKFHLGAMAVEMEGKGIFVAAHDMKSEWVVVKGVSHFADSSTHESWKTFACVMAASLVSNILCDPYVFEQWPHYGDIPTQEERSKSPSRRDLPCSTDSPDAKKSSLSVQPTEQHMKDMNEQQELDLYKEHDTWLELAKQETESFCDSFIYSEQQTDAQRKQINLFVARFEDCYLCISMYHCVGCGVKLSGRRYHCLNCWNVDFCYDCYMAGEKQDGHTESHDVIEIRYKCGVCKGFILGAQFCCYKCPDFFLCIVCKSRHPADHQVTQFPIKKETLAEECEKQLQSHYNTFSKIKMIPWDQSSAIHINNIYTQLSWVRDDRKPSGVTQEKLEDYTDIFRGDKHHPNPKRILVYGRPGIGKSTFSKKASFDWSQQEKMILMKFNLVLLIKLRDVCNMKEIRDVLKASQLLPADGVISIDDVFDYVLCNQEKVLLILDGYDEYSCTGEQSPVREIWESALLRDSYVIMTTRHMKVDELRGATHVQFEINGFKSEGQVKAFANKFLEDVDEFVKDLEGKDLKEMAEIPLLLLMLCLLWKEKLSGGLPKSRAGIYTGFIQTLMDHQIGKHADAKQFKKVDDYKEELCNLGKLAFDSLLQDCFSFHVTELPNDILSTKLIEVGLFHVLNAASLTPKKVVDFIHKSFQEFLAAFYLKEELLKQQSTSCLSEVDSFEKIVKMIEVLKFACELSAEAACAVLSHLGMIGKKEGLTEYEFSETPSEEEFTEDQRQFLTLISHSFFCCTAEKRQDLYSMFLSYVGGVLLIDSDQLHSVADEHLLKSAAAPKYIFFQYSNKYSELSYRDLITVVEDVNAVVVSCSGEKNASDFLKKYPLLSTRDFFLKKEGKMNIYINTIKTSVNITFPTEILKELISSPECTQKKKQRVGDQSNEQDNRTALCLTDNNDSTTGQPRQCLSRVYYINIFGKTSQEMETLIDVLPFVSFPQRISIRLGAGAAELVETLTETLVSHNFTNRLIFLALHEINLTAKAAGVIARSLHQAPNLRLLDLSWNPLGEGVSVFTRHLSDVPDLKELYLDDVKMAKKQVNDLTEAVRQSKISTLWSSYHDEEGNLKPEQEWPTEEHWKERPWLDPGELTDPEDELQSEASTEQED